MPDKSLFGGTERSMRKSSVVETVGTHAPWPVMYTRGSSPMMGPSLTSLGQARTSPLRRPCFTAFQRPRRSRIAGPAKKFASYSSVRWRSRWKARCLGDVSSTPASARPQCVPPRTHRYTRHRQAAGSVPLFRCTNVSAATATHAAPSMPADAPTVTQEKEPATAIILDAEDATTTERIEA